MKTQKAIHTLIVLLLIAGSGVATEAGSPEGKLSLDLQEAIQADGGDVRVVGLFGSPSFETLH